MKPSNVDRFIAEAQGDAQIESVEVHVTATDEARAAGSIGRPYIALLAIAALATVATLIVTSLPSGRVHGRASPTSATSAASCVHADGYGGLGARTDLFDANNNYSTSSSEPTPGNAFYLVTGTTRGCVTSFSVEEAASPPLSGRILLFLVSGPFLPRDAVRVVNTDTCAVWKSASLHRATGSAYATASALAQVGSVPGRAAIEVTSSQGC